MLILIKSYMKQCRCHHLPHFRIGLPANYHRQLQETWPFATTGPGTGSAGLSDIKLLNRSGPVYCRSFQL